MATWYLLNNVTLQSTVVPVGIGSVLLAGTEVDDTKTPLAPIQAAGGVLWPSADPVVAAAAALCQKFQTNRGANEEALNTLMIAAVARSIQGGSASVAGLLQHTNVP